MAAILAFYCTQCGARGAGCACPDTKAPGPYCEVCGGRVDGEPMTVDQAQVMRDGIREKVTMNVLYVLDGHTPVQTQDIKAVEAAIGTSVAHENLVTSRVSTVFLGIDHSYVGGPPVLFESKVFGGVLHGTCARYETWEDAEAGHAQLVSRVAKAEAAGEA